MIGKKIVDYLNRRSPVEKRKKILQDLEKTGKIYSLSVSEIEKKLGIYEDDGAAPYGYPVSSYYKTKPTTRSEKEVEKALMER